MAGKQKTTRASSVRKGAAHRGSPCTTSQRPNEGSVAVEHVERSILTLRGHRVMLDETLAELYGVPVRVLNQAVKRNLERFPEDFMFQLTEDEGTSLRSQTVILEPSGRGQHRKYRAYTLTKQGVAMLSSVLRSPQALAVNIEIMRNFVRLRRMLQEHAALAKKLAALGEKYDAQFRVVFDAIRELMASPVKPKQRIVFGKDQR